MIWVTFSSIVSRFVRHGFFSVKRPREGASRKANPSADVALGLTCCREEGAQILERLSLFQRTATKSDDVLGPGARLH